MEDRDDYRVAIAAAFGFSGRIADFMNFLGYGVQPDDDEEEPEDYNY